MLGGMRINPYSTLSKIYDISREHEDIAAWSAFILQIISDCSIKKHSHILDCGCGTGDISILLAKQGYTVDAIDTSSDMLMMAKEKTHNLGLKVNYTVQDMRTFKSHNLYSLITCINDGINYLNTLEDVELFLKNCYQYLSKDCYLLFDISTEYKLKNMSGEFFAEEGDDFAYIWSNEYDEDSKHLTMDITFFNQIKEDVFRRTSEMHVQRAHSMDEINTLLKNTGYETAAIFGDISSESPADTSQRIHFLVKKV